MNDEAMNTIKSIRMEILKLDNLLDDLGNYGSEHISRLWRAMAKSSDDLHDMSERVLAFIEENK